jgi:hypothetical protein
MYKVNIKKLTMVFSTIAILLMVTITSTSTMNSSALDLGLISKDNNFGSIDTENMFNCFGAAITCDNDNTVNNNIAINNGTNGGGGNPLTCEECFTENLTPEQIETLLDAGFGFGPTPQTACGVLMEFPNLLANLETRLLEIGIDASVVAEIIACIEEALGL